MIAPDFIAKTILQEQQNLLEQIKLQILLLLALLPSYPSSKTASNSGYVIVLYFFLLLRSNPNNDAD
jgi:hypothetical protein